VEAEPVFSGGRDAARRLIAGEPKPDAIISVNDLVSMGVLSQLHASGVRVPEDVSVAGYDDLVFSAMLETPLTTVRQPLEEMCRLAADMLFRQIAGGQAEPEPVLLEPELVVRAST
jgi:DNA-binding LacI/PurR family transcriptional regulator